MFHDRLKNTFFQETIEKQGLQELLDFKVNLEGMVNSHMFSAEGMGKGNILAYVSHKFTTVCV